MSIRRLVVVLALALLLSAPVLAFTPGGNRIAVLQTAERHHGAMERAVSHAMPAALAAALRKAGYDAEALNRTIDEAGSAADDFDLLVEVIYYDADTDYLGGVGFGSNGVGAEVAMAYAVVDARVVLYEGGTLRSAGSFDVRARTTSPVLAGVGVGGRDGFLFLRLPFRLRSPYRQVTRAFAQQAARQIAAR